MNVLPKDQPSAVYILVLGQSMFHMVTLNYRETYRIRRCIGMSDYGSAVAV